MAHIHVLSLEARRSGGAGTYTGELVRQLAARGHRIDLICHQADPELDQVCQIHRLPIPRAGRLPWAWRVAVLLRQREYNRYIRTLPLQEPDAVIGSAQQMLPEHACRFPAAPLIYVPHSLVAPLEVQGMPWASLLQRWAAVRVFRSLEEDALNRAFCTIRFTRTGCDSLNLYFGSKIKTRFIILPTPVPIPGPPDRNRFPKVPKLLFVGRLVESKNVAWLIRALYRLAHLPWTCDIVGDGDERQRLEELVHQHELTGRIVFHGHQNQVDAFYCQASLFVFPSRLENSPIVLLEAMSFGIPTLSIRADGRRYLNANHEIVTTDHDGFLAGSEEEFVVKLQELLTSPEHLKEVGAQARSTVEKRNRWEDHILGYERIFEEIQTKSEIRFHPVLSRGASPARSKLR
jgi:glycosyltransferase involved in cell wall biosynthesis